MGIFSGGPKKTTTQDITSNQTQQTQGTGAQQTQNTSLNQQAGTQSSTNQQSGQFSNSTTPNLPAWYSQFLQSIPGQYQSLAATLGQNASRPLIGTPQQAAFQNDLAQNQAAQHQALQSQLASQGALNSGRNAQMSTQLALGGQKQLSDYLASVPQQNAAYQTQNLQQLAQLLGQGQSFTSPVSAFGTTQSGTSQQTTLNDLITSLLSGGYGTSESANQTASTGATTGNTSGTQTEQTHSNLLGGLLNGAIQGGLGAATGGIVK